jgi:catechol 2,3-dioxygenase-like lactoylglutathione lyase family enzyme
LNVPDAAAMADWYVENCGMRIVRASEGPPHMRFVADSTGRTVFELYSNEAAPIPDYAQQHHLCLHIAFAVSDANAERARLLAAGASVVEEQHLPDGTHLVMLRDPWGVALQLCARSTPLP